MKLVRNLPYVTGSFSGIFRFIIDEYGESAVKWDGTINTDYKGTTMSVLGKKANEAFVSLTGYENSFVTYNINNGKRILINPSSYSINELYDYEYYVEIVMQCMHYTKKQWVNLSADTVKNEFGGGVHTNINTYVHFNTKNQNICSGVRIVLEKQSSYMFRAVMSGFEMFGDVLSINTNSCICRKNHVYLLLFFFCFIVSSS